MSIGRIVLVGLHRIQDDCWYLDSTLTFGGLYKGQT